MRKTTILLSFALAVAVSTSADAAAKKHHHHHTAVPVTAGDTGGSPYMDATEAQRAKFFQDAFFPLGAK
jgi:hypothetical protein